MKLGSRSKANRRLILQLATGCVLVLCVLMSLSVIKRYHLEREMAARVVEAQTEYQALQDRKAELKKKVDYLKDDRSIEAALRRSFDVAKDGEEVVIILDDDNDASSVQPVAPSEPEPSAPWYEFWR